MAVIRRLALLTFSFFLFPFSVTACPFCGGQGQTLTGEVNEASLVVFGTLSKARLDPGSDFGSGTTELNIEAVLKNHEVLGGKKVLVLPRYLPSEDKTVKFLIFCGVFKTKVDPYRGIQVKSNSDIVKYLQGALAHKDKSISERLKFSFQYLDNPDIEIAMDAYKEFANADYKDYRDMAKQLPADTLARWLADPETPSFRLGLYASLLGHCGTDKHADLLRKMLDDPIKRVSTGLDGLLAGYTMLKPKEGWAYVTSTLKDPKKEFMLRYAGLRAARFLWEYRPDLVDKNEIVKGICLLLDQGDIADYAIEDLRKWGRWEVSEQVLDLYGKKSHDIPIVHRAILRYALSCQQQAVNDLNRMARASAFVADIRKKTPEKVHCMEELLKLEKGEK